MDEGGLGRMGTAANALRQTTPAPRVGPIANAIQVVQATSISLQVISERLAELCDRLGISHLPETATQVGLKDGASDNSLPAGMLDELSEASNQLVYNRQLVDYQISRIWQLL